MIFSHKNSYTAPLCFPNRKWWLKIIFQVLCAISFFWGKYLLILLCRARSVTRSRTRTTARRRPHCWWTTCGCRLPLRLPSPSRPRRWISMRTRYGRNYLSKLHGLVKTYKRSHYAKIRHYSSHFYVTQLTDKAKISWFCGKSNTAE